MYKNFNLTESEKESILKQHKSYGYGKPLNEQYNDGEEINEPDMESEPELEDEGMTPPLKMDSNVLIECQEFTIFFMSESGGEAYVRLRMSYGEVVDAKVTNNETGVDSREIMSMVRQKIKEGLFSNFPESVTWNMDNDTCSTNQ
jgi:hypothetical protein